MRDTGGEKTPEVPKLARRKDHKKSVWKSGRTIGEHREKLETASERTAAHKRNEKKKRLRLLSTAIGFLLIAGILIWLLVFFLNGNHPDNYSPTIEVLYAPTIEVVDEDASAAAGGSITARMKEYIGQAEADFRELGYVPVKAVIPKGTIREVDFYLDGKPGFIKLIIDRGSGVSVEDADRMLRYLEGAGITNYAYIDVRIDGKAYWK